ncbi:flippase [bacterium]|nr:flippase [bacterium]
MIKELFKDIAKYLPAQIVPALVGIFALPIITRFFSPNQYGNYVLVTTTISIFSIISVGWLSSSMVRFLPLYEQTGRLGEFYSLTLKWAILSIIVFSVLFWALLSLLNSRISSSLYSLMQIGLLLFVVTSLSTVLTQLLRAKRQTGRYSFFKVWHSVVGLGLGIVMVVLFGFSIEGLLWGYIISLVVVLPLLWEVSIGRPSIKEGKLCSPMSREIAMYGIPSVGVGLLSWALSLSDRYILEFFRSAEEVGIYSVSYTVSEHTIFLVTSLFLFASTPIAFSIWERQGVKASQDFTQKLTRYFILVSLPAAVGLSVLSYPIADILLAPEYLQGYRIIPVVAIGALFVGFSHRFSTCLGYHKRNDLNMICFLGAAVLNVLLNFIFIPTYGYIGAAATTFVSYAALLFLEIIISRRFFIWNFPFSSLGKTALASAVMAAVVYPIGNSFTSSVVMNLILGVAVGVVVYTLMLFVLREVNKQEIQTMKDIKARLFIN